MQPSFSLKINLFFLHVDNLILSYYTKGNLILLKKITERNWLTLKKQMMTTGTKYKLILMSATINRERFQEYFASR